MHLEARKDWDGSEAYLIAIVSDAKKTKSDFSVMVVL